uniref:Uncharacterized protein n=1 Tax=Aegilops tauschii subsp. strangulata TaxID=200361 RepID=A0A453D8D6_AEGTS
PHPERARRALPLLLSSSNPALRRSTCSRPGRHGRPEDPSFCQAGLRMGTPQRRRHGLGPLPPLLQPAPSGSGLCAALDPRRPRRRWRCCSHAAPAGSSVNWPTSRSRSPALATACSTAPSTSSTQESTSHWPRSCSCWATSSAA